MSLQAEPVDNETQRPSNEDSAVYPNIVDSRPSWKEWKPCTAILRGEAVPCRDSYQCYGPASRLQQAIRISLIYAIRTYLPYAQREEIVSLCDTDAWAARARNARLIMSNIIPDIDIQNRDHFPYCIWYPDMATEDTYRKVLERYPNLKYQVGRACAIAGYVKLYRELDILPEISIAEEARESENGNEIYRDIMDRPLRFKVMDDYTRTVREDKDIEAGAGLNGDTEVVAYMRAHRRVPHQAIGWDYTLRWDEAQRAVGFYEFAYFDIAEDGNVAPPEGIVDPDGDLPSDYDSLATPENEPGEEGPSQTASNSTYTPRDAWLLYSPLPRDLPPINKDLLILHAAWEGNVDRYARLRRPFRLLAESDCIVRGIYHSTAFAKWWYAQPDCDIDFLRAARSRFVMKNDISWLYYRHPRDREAPGGKPWLPRYMIWWPEQPLEEMMRELAAREPRMRVQVAHAAIYCHYLALFLELDVAPTDILLEEARISPHPEYLHRLQRKGPDPSQYYPPSLAREARFTARREKESPSELVFTAMRADHITYGAEGGPYLGLSVGFTDVDLFISTPVELMIALLGTWYNGSQGAFVLDYIDSEFGSEEAEAEVEVFEAEEARSEESQPQLDEAEEVEPEEVQPEELESELK